MIVVSLLLILVAVTLLALGLAGGSSPLLISSIVASLLAAVALVVGARQAATQRRQPLYADPPGARLPADSAPGPSSARRGARRRNSAAASAASSAAYSTSRGDAPSDFSGSDPILSDDDRFPDAAAPRRSPEAESGMGEGRSLDEEHGSADNPRAVDAEPDLATSGPSSDARPDLVEGSRSPDAESDAAIESLSESDARAAGGYDASAALVGDSPFSDSAPQEPDFEGASTATGPARASESPSTEHSSADPFFEAHLSDPPGPSADAPQTSRAGVPEASEAGEPETSEIDEPDELDPADEPPPQSVRPSDAVSVARIDAEVLVVDGRPRYHLGDCPHLVGRHAEPLPVNEAVELGFSPCGQCRPVSRLVAQAAHR